METEAAFSPDGNTIAFSGEYDGNVDVFTMPASGGVPKRITYHPDADRVVGWTPDGKHILFRSNRLSYSRYTSSTQSRRKADCPTFCRCRWPPSALIRRMASIWFTRRWMAASLRPASTTSWPGNGIAAARASYLWVVNLADLSTVKIPRTDSNDIYPMWIGDKIYFLSDRNGRMTLFSYDPKSKAVTN